MNPDSWWAIVLNALLVFAVFSVGAWQGRRERRQEYRVALKPVAQQLRREAADHYDPHASEVLHCAAEAIEIELSKR